MMQSSEFTILFGEPHILDPNSTESLVEVGTKGLEILSSKPLYFQKIAEDIVGEAYVFGQLFSIGYAKITEHISQEGSTAILSVEKFSGLRENVVKKIDIYFERGQKFEDLLKVREVDPAIIWIGSATIHGFAALYGHLDIDGNYDSFIVDSNCIFGTEPGDVCLQTLIEAKFRKPQTFIKTVPIARSPNITKSTLSPLTQEFSPSPINLGTPTITPVEMSPFLRKDYPSPQVASKNVGIFGSPSTPEYTKYRKHNYNLETDTLTYNAKYYFPDSSDGRTAEKIPLSPGEAEGLETELAESLERYPGTQVRVSPETKEIVITFTGQELQDSPKKFIKDVDSIFSKARYELTRKGKTYTLYVKPL